MQVSEHPEAGYVHAHPPPRNREYAERIRLDLSVYIYVLSACKEQDMYNIGAGPDSRSIEFEDMDNIGA